jgi:hypothetical protein
VDLVASVKKTVFYSGQEYAGRQDKCNVQKENEFNNFIDELWKKRKVF